MRDDQAGGRFVGAERVDGPGAKRGDDRQRFVRPGGHGHGLGYVAKVVERHTDDASFSRWVGEWYGGRSPEPFTKLLRSGSVLVLDDALTSFAKIFAQCLLNARVHLFIGHAARLGIGCELEKCSQ